MIQIGKRSLILIKIFIVILYWLLIFPIGLLCRILGVETLDFSWRNGPKTYWNIRKNEKPADRYSKQL